MYKLYITDFDKARFRPKELSSLVKPFYDSENAGWSSEPAVLSRRGCGDLKFELVPVLDQADAVLVSEPLDHRHDRKRYRELEQLNTRCRELNIDAHVFITGDFGKVHPRFSNIFYYRLGGFRTQLDDKNRAFFPLVSDQLKALFDRNEIVLREKGSRPVVGFCGHATTSLVKKLYEQSKFVRLNAERLFYGDRHLEPLFASAFERRKLLDLISGSGMVDTNFVCRERYRAGARTDDDRKLTTIEYYRNIIESDYILCVRGGGNFSVRLYETLMMGRIPILVNTNGVLPLENRIDWKRHVVWIEWDQRSTIPQRVVAHFSEMDATQFRGLQIANRDLWRNKLSIREYLRDVLGNDRTAVRTFAAVS